METAGSWRPVGLFGSWAAPASGCTSVTLAATGIGALCSADGAGAGAEPGAWAGATVCGAAGVMAGGLTGATGDGTVPGVAGMTGVGVG
jgi:hypothetical protein